MFSHEHNALRPSGDISGVNYQAVLLDHAMSRIYAFRAERMNVSTSSIFGSSELEPNASNLACVLHLLQASNISKFRRYVSAINAVFPHVKQITVPPVSGGSSARILVWSVDPDTERDDLAVPLSESGTGIGQVLAILYVVLTADTPRIIIIDEPQSFLHPGAVRKLIGILQQYPQHQYIITTHSPTVVTATHPDTILLVRRTDSESVIDELDPAHAEQVQLLLLEVGARLSDVFGAENILWVEGQTEEMCFPEILQRICKRPLFGTEIIGVAATGDFDARRPRAAFEIYRRLSRGRGVLPPALGFIFDREQRNQRERDDLIRESDGTVHFLPRRMYENYLLRPEAVAAVCSGTEGFRESPVTADEVSVWVDTKKWDRKYFGRVVVEGQRSDTLWYQNIDGAKLLHDLFAELSEHRVTFQKTRHSVELTRWLIEHCPEDLADVGQLLSGILPTPPA